MTVMVDELVSYGQAPQAGAERYFGNGKQSCHLTTDGPLDELHAFAARLGLQRAWFQAGSHPHYDLTPSKRHQALRMGAVEVTARDQARQTSADKPAITIHASGEYEIAPPVDGCDGVFLHPKGRAMLGHVWDRDSAYAWVNLARNPAYGDQRSDDPYLTAPDDWQTRVVRELPGLPF